MSAKRFRFVSPGVKIVEIDRSIISTGNTAVGPVVIGKFQRGPGLLPVTVDNYESFEGMFGEPVTGKVSGDLWRSGLLQSPTYAGFASKAWFKAANPSVAPLTAVRVLGVQHPAAETSGLAGWKAQGGAYGIFMAPSGSNVTGALAAVVYLSEGSVEVAGPDLAGTGQVAGSNKFVKTVGNDLRFKLIIKDASGSVVSDIAAPSGSIVNLDSIRSLNTNPVLVNGAIVPDEVKKTYWVGETFETFVKEKITNTAAGNVFVCAVPLQSGTCDFGNHLGNQAQPAKTGWVIAQDLNTATGSFQAENMPKLFRFSTIGGEVGDSSGEFEQKNYGVVIHNITPSSNVYDKYGKFDVSVVGLADGKVKQTFSSVNLNPLSPDYIAKKIGDTKTIWNSELSKHDQIGAFPNASSFITIEMHPSVELGILDPKLLPFGFFGPPKFNDASSLGSTDTLFSGTVDTDGVALTASLQFPEMPLMKTPIGANVLTPTGVNLKAVFGLKTLAGNVFNQDIYDLVRCKPACDEDISSYEAVGDLLQNSTVFTLDDVVINGQLREWMPGSRVSGQSITAISSSEDVLNDRTAFMLPLFGGTDGVNICEKDPFRNTYLGTLAAGDVEGKTNYAVYSLKRALDSIADPETLDMNLLVVPGVTDEFITGRAIEICENRADALAIIDIEGSFEPESENKTSELARYGSVQKAINAVKARQFNTSYACTYYPWVKIRATDTEDLWVPPSVVVAGVMASSEANTAVWFAPAGFNRGGLSSVNGNLSGFSVNQAREKLKSTQRDKLYEVNINPIATFPGEGIVIFGQKTLQATPSALDRINVRRMVLFLKKQVSRIASNLLFDQNIKTTWQRFLNQVNPLMEGVKAGGGLADYKVVLDETTTTPDLIDRNTMYAKIFIKPAYAIEFIGIDFIITNSGASFDDL